MRLYSLVPTEILRIALLVSGSIIPMIIEDEFEYPIPEHTPVLTADLFYRLSITPFFSLFQQVYHLTLSLSDYFA